MRKTAACMRPGVVRLVAVLLTMLLGAGSGRAQAVWFGAVPNMTTPHGYNIDPDFPALFTAPSQWPNGLARVAVFQFDRAYILAQPIAALQPRFAFLAQHGIAIAVAMGVVESTNGCGKGVEGMVFGPNVNRGMAQKIAAAGGTLAFIVADEPYTFGYKSRKPGACRDTIADVAASFAREVASIRTVFPHVGVVDNEASSFLKDTVDAMLWVDTLKADLGPSMQPVMSLDVQWEHKFWLTWAQPFVTLLAQHGMGYSIIYHSIGFYRSDSTWLQTAEQFAADWEATVATQPDHVVLQSWNPAPSHVLPEADPTALTSFILAYCNQITKWPVACNGLH